MISSIQAINYLRDIKPIFSNILDEHTVCLRIFLLFSSISFRFTMHSLRKNRHTRLQSIIRWSKWNARCIVQCTRANANVLYDGIILVNKSCIRLDLWSTIHTRPIGWLYIVSHRSVDCSYLREFLPSSTVQMWSQCVDGVDSLFLVWSVLTNSFSRKTPQQPILHSRACDYHAILENKYCAMAHVSSFALDFHQISSVLVFVKYRFVI